MDVQSHVHAHVGLVLWGMGWGGWGGEGGGGWGGGGGGGGGGGWPSRYLFVPFVFILWYFIILIILFLSCQRWVLWFYHSVIRQPLCTYEMKRVSALLSLSAENPPVTDWFVLERASKSGLWYYFSTWTIHFTNSRVAGGLGAHVMHSMGLCYLICLPGHRMPDSVSINSVSRL